MNGEIFKPGDLVLILGNNENTGSVTSIARRCDVCACALLSLISTGLSFYQLNGIPGSCFRENILKKIDGDRPKAETKTDETRDAPVEA